MTCPVNAWRIVLWLGLCGVVSSSRGAEGDSQDGGRLAATWRHTLLESGDHPSRSAALEPDPVLRNDPSFVIMERRFLDGKITAKQFTRFIREHSYRLSLRGATNVVTNPSAVTAAPAQSKPPPAERRPPAAKPAGDDEFEPLDLSALEEKMSELLRLKRERQLAAQTNVVQVDLMDPKAKLTKRERLDLLLKLYVDNKISATEYKEKRAKIMAMP